MIRSARLAIGFCLALAGVLAAPAHADAGASAGAGPGVAGVASAHPAATAAGRAVIDRGGNAFDAAIAIAAALAVVEPYSSGIGGGGFFLLQRAAAATAVMIDAREKAPLAATRDMFLDAAGEFVRARAMDGPLAAGIPGTPAGLVHLAEHYGRLPLADVLAPAIRLAEEGYAVTEHYRDMAGFRLAALRADPATAAIFLTQGEVPADGVILKQPALAAVLRALATAGRAGFYAGKVAAQLVAGVRAAGGIWTEEDLAGYQIVEREPIVGTYRDLRIVSAPPPSSGGIVLVEALNILEAYDLPALDPTTRQHVIIEAMRRAYRDRADYLGDPDFYEMPTAHLIDKRYAREIAADLVLDRATPSAALNPVGSPPKQGPHTTHFSVLDAQGNRVAATLSINYPFGACFTPAGTGVLLNNEMDDFSPRPLTPNAYGLIGDEANAIAPGKRPLSSMTPTFLETGERLGILGTPGGSRIISMVLLGTLAFAAGEASENWVSLPRYHHQYLPDEVLYEPAAFDTAARADLARRGHALKESTRRYGNMQAILWDKARGSVTAAADPRGEGAAAVWKPALSVARTSVPAKLRAIGVK